MATLDEIKKAISKLHGQKTRLNNRYRYAQDKERKEILKEINVTEEAINILEKSKLPKSINKKVVKVPDRDIVKAHVEGLSVEDIVKKFKKPYVNINVHIVRAVLAKYSSLVESMNRDEMLKITNKIKLGNPRSPESFLSIFLPLKKIESVQFPQEKAILNAIMRELGRFERQDIVEASLYLERAYMLNEMLASNLRQKMNATERELTAKLLKKTWTKISNEPINPDTHTHDRAGDANRPGERNQDYTDTRQLRATIREKRDALNHYGDMIQNNARFGRLFRDSKLSFATQTVDDALLKLHMMEQKIQTTGDDFAHEKASENATETIEYLELTPELKWFRILDSHCSFEAEMMGHCASEGGNGVNLFSLREKRGKYFYPVVTAAWHPLHGGSGEEISEGDTQGYLTQIKGTKNSKPLSKWHQAIVALLMDDEVGFIKKSNYKPELDFSIDDLEPELKAKVLKAKPGLASWKKFVEGIAMKNLVGLAKDQVGTNERAKRMKLVDEDTVILFQADDPEDFWKNLVSELVPKRMSEEIDRQFEYLDQVFDMDFRESEVPLDDLLTFLETKEPDTYEILVGKLEAYPEFEEIAEEYDLEKYVNNKEKYSNELRKAIVDFLQTNNESAEEIFACFSDAYRDGLEVGTRDEAYQNVMKGFDGYEFYNGNGTMSVVCRRDPEKPYLWTAEIDKQALAKNLIEYQEQDYSSDFLDYMFSANSDNGELQYRRRNNNSFFWIKDTDGSYDEDAANERLVDALYQVGVKAPKKAKNPQFKKMSYKDLIKEHTNLVKILKSGNKKAISKEMIEQEKELRQYIKESRK